MNYLKKILFLFRHINIKSTKRSYAVFGVWRVELIITAFLLLIVAAADFWIYYNMVSRGVEASSDRVSTVEVLNNKAIADASTTISAHENKLDNPEFPLIKSPF